MSDLQNTASILWQTIGEEHVSGTRLAKAMSLLPSKVDKSYYQDPDKLILIKDVFSHQPSTPALLKKWQKHFLANSQLSESLARQFINEVLASLEDVDKLVPQELYAGETVMQQHSATDYTIKRVMRKKKGWSLHLTVQGKGHYNCIRQQLLTKPGDLVLISPEGIYDYHREVKSKNWSHYWIYFNQNNNWSRWMRWPEVGPGIYHLNVSGKAYRRFHELFEECISICHKAPPHSIELSKNLTEQILIRCYQQLPHENTEELNGKIAQVTHYISQHYAEDFDLQTLADETYLSKPRLSALFREETGTSIMRWRDERRMSKACELLANSSIPINQIAEQVGYKDPLYFSRTFSQHLNCSPRKYRNRRTRNQ